ncbi:MAG: hypothetical protein Q9160_000161 [Pyrenula sp. 1 TL-2023]
MKLSSILSVLSISLLASALPATEKRDASVAAVAEEAKREAAPMIPTEPSGGGGVDACWVKLSCTYAQIEAMSMQKRLDFVRYIENVHLASIGAQKQIEAIAGVVEFFIKFSLGAPGGWISRVDAGIIEGQMRGAAMTLGYSQADGGNPGSAKWKAFFTGIKEGTLKDRGDHDKAWSEAEQASTEYGKGIADAKGNASGHENRWYQFTQLFRWIMRHRTATKVALYALFFPSNIPLALAAGPLVDWLTNVTDDFPAKIGSELAWGLTQFDTTLGGDFMMAKDLLKTFIPKLYEAYKDHH